MKKEIFIHADGACSGNPGPGGWAATISRGEGDILILTGGNPHTTNNVMELTAAREGLKEVLASGDIEGSTIILRLDSEYVLKGLGEWMPNWKKRGWRTAAGGDVKNRDIWIEIDELKTRIEGRASIKLVHVKGHSGDPENERVDDLAVEARDRARCATSSWQDPVRRHDAEVSQENKEFERIRNDAEKRGYTLYVCPTNSGKKGYAGSFQKKITDGEDVLYFVDVELWDMAIVTRGQRIGIVGDVNTQFHDRDNLKGEARNISFIFRTFEDAERDLYAVWSRMGYGRYETQNPSQTLRPVDDIIRQISKLDIEDLRRVQSAIERLPGSLPAPHFQDEIISDPKM